MEAFQAWRLKEEEEKVVEFVKGDTHASKAVPPRFKDHTKLVCARHTRSGRKKYVKKFPERVRKVPSRKMFLNILMKSGLPIFLSPNADVKYRERNNQRPPELAVEQQQRVSVTLQARQDLRQTLWLGPPPQGLPTYVPTILTTRRHQHLLSIMYNRRHFKRRLPCLLPTSPSCLKPILTSHRNAGNA
ncbi:hypothetical protein PHLCEN_2v2727 [Hermanssonia centrifuga]|uniref:Uncharacterized protein n=1 Tax=Hermanssonia centrifuga TaxID=98765 RepID=A0A2R6RHU1_9APHY|nr:hypothetical protein PHLCEN_2v2727 [Hermanssonia centrifuga]